MKEYSSFSRGLITAAAFVVVVSGIKMAETLIVPFLLSVFIALIFSPFLAWLKANKVPNTVSICLIISCMVSTGWIISLLIGSSLEDFQKNMPVYEERIQGMNVVLSNWLSDLGLAFNIGRVDKILNPNDIMQIMGNALTSFGNVLTNVFMILLTVIFILAEEVGFGEKLQSARKCNGSVNEGLVRFLDSVHSYLRIKSLLSLLTGGLVAVTLWLLGVDYPVMWGLVAFLLNFIPTVGSIIAAIPTILLAIIQLGPLTASFVAVSYLTINIFVGNLLEPKLMGRGLNLSPLVVFLSLVFWGWILGPVGMLLSIPLTIMSKIALENDKNTRWIGVMLGANNGQSKTLQNVTSDHRVD